MNAGQNLSRRNRDTLNDFFNEIIMDDGNSDRSTRLRNIRNLHLSNIRPLTTPTTLPLVPARNVDIATSTQDILEIDPPENQAIVPEQVNFLRLIPVLD